MKIGQSSGGYMTAWSEAEHFKPNDGETVLFHLKTWEPDEYSIGSYLPADGIVLLGGEPVPYSAVDYWMRIPPIPGYVKPYIIGDNWSQEEKPLNDLIKLFYEGMTHEEIEADFRKQIELMVKIHKAEME